MRRVYNSRSPHGERGLKLRQGVRRTVEHPSRSPHGERGLKWNGGEQEGALLARRSPHGERGLKYSWTCGDCPSADVALLMESVD